jgi:hypothetical protein
MVVAVVAQVLREVQQPQTKVAMVVLELHQVLAEVVLLTLAAAVVMQKQELGVLVVQVVVA